MKYKIITLALTGFFLFANANTPVKVDKTVISKAEQDKLTPAKVITLLKEGNKRFISGKIRHRDSAYLIKDAVASQHPKAIILSCVDSRVPVEELFDLSIGDVFVARVAGNFENTDILGSMEFATKLSGAKVVLVLGHEYCGAVKASIDDAKLGNITAMLNNIKPAVEHFKNYDGEKSSKNKEFVAKVMKQNVLQTVTDIRKNSPIMKKLEDEGKLKIIGAHYSLKGGKVNFLD